MKRDGEGGTRWQSHELHRKGKERKKSKMSQNELNLSDKYYFSMTNIQRNAHFSVQ